jgi:hypothetical protein
MRVWAWESTGSIVPPSVIQSKSLSVSEIQFLSLQNIDNICLTQSECTQAAGIVSHTHKLSIYDNDNQNKSFVSSLNPDNNLLPDC